MSIIFKVDHNYNRFQDASGPVENYEDQQLKLLKRHVFLIKNAMS
jgi:hypothetical protein